MTERAVPAPETVTVPLRIPLGPRAEIVLRRPTAAEFRPLPMSVLRAEGGRRTGATWGDMLAMVSGCSGVSMEELDEIATPDAVDVVNGMNEFLDVDVKAARAARVRLRADGVTVQELARPLKLGSQKLERLEYQPCKGKHLRAMPIEPSIGDLLTLAGSLTLQAEAIMDRLDVDDTMVLIEVTSDFFGVSRKAGS